MRSSAACRWCSAACASISTAASPVTRTATCSRTRSSTRCWARPGLGDIGSLFPSDDARYHGASSLDLLREAYRQVNEAGWTLVNADCILIGEQPRIAPHREEMRPRLSEALGGGEVNVRATTTDHLGFTGRGEGLAAQAVALLERA